ncbi:hypothetical protein NP233_g9023 [Leucocoprinus birnbaumii]|uniref:Uncharacterized protein n=1 Tax=Leucocoprinus birnbaumii TaxID=56174 RepID=A0AAD5YTA6_9AGAR|nr:hypothetical protein NP233_g9023 [Leucocoprinus birnbaumii]
MAVNNGDDPRDEDWVPAKLRWKQAQRKKSMLNYQPNNKSSADSSIEKKNEGPVERKKGPDVASKSTRTRCRYRELISDQVNLEYCGFQPRSQNNIEPDSLDETASESDVIDLTMSDNERGSSSEASQNPANQSSDVTVIHDSSICDLDSQADVAVESDGGSEAVLRKRKRLDSETGSSDLEGTTDLGSEFEMSEADREVEEVDLEREKGKDCEDWEDELEETVVPKGSDIRSWTELRNQIIGDLQRKYKSLSISEVNRLMILRNFATLQIKGYSRFQASFSIAVQWRSGGTNNAYFARMIRALARHYQAFEQLPPEKRGGSHAHSLFKDERVRSAARMWLTDQPLGTVTPLKFHHALCDEILPSLGFSLNKPPCLRTARRWMVKLGWFHSVVRKGVYMDGHEREDVVKYRQEVFLPKMLEFERRMAKYIPNPSGEGMIRIEPELKEGEKELGKSFSPIIFPRLPEGKQPLRKKGRGRLIHNSEFIEQVNGRLVVYNEDGSIKREARKIIYPGANGDPWWDCQQLIEQVKTQAIPTFEEAHPGCQALFMFDQSSAHASLPPDALKAFEMNKSNGGKQRRQRDTVIPQSNPDPRFRGMVQKMTTETGEPKGLKQTLEERGFKVSHLITKCSPVCPFESTNCCMARLLSQQDDFINQESMLERVIRDAGHECIFLPKFHCEMNPIEMYWGWVKFRYRQVPKPTFEDAKKAAIDAFDACPVDVIRRFINRSWRFMSAYRLGLTGKAAAWAVRKQKGHRAVSNAAMMHLDAVVDQNSGT